MRLLLLFALTLFTSAMLLFLVQPMVGKMILPMLGGTPAVWNTCMVFFQALLLVGYLYAHITTSVLGPRQQAFLHIVVLGLPFLTLSLVVDRTLLDYGEGNPIPGLLLGLVLSVGLPFFVVSTSAPILQRWFADTGHPAAQDPYFLYGASNLGSMLALIGYPALVEPWLTLAQQRFLWQIGYVTLALLIILCAFALWRSKPTASLEERETGALPQDAAPSFMRRLRWVALAFVPSSLMLGVTTYMTTDIAAIPLLWVLPLGLYLLSFILVFSRMPLLIHRIMVLLLPVAVLPLVFLMLSSYPLPIYVKIPAHLGVMFIVSMVCHGELARDRPPARYLTAFYLVMSLGGVLGGLFNALVAPQIFTGIAEYPLALVIACLMTPNLEQDRTRIRPVLGFVLMAFFLGVAFTLFLPALGREDLSPRGLISREGAWLLAAVVLGLILARFGPHGDPDRPQRWLDFALPLALGLLAVGLNLGLRVNAVHRGLDRLVANLRASLPEWVPDRFSEIFQLASRDLITILVFAFPAALCYLFAKRPVRLGLSVGALFLASHFCSQLDGDVLLRSRSFFGSLVVSDGTLYRRLEHGTTLHGWQRLRWHEETRQGGILAVLAGADPIQTGILAAASEAILDHPGREALTYFHRSGPIGHVFDAEGPRLEGNRIAIVGLGTGTLAAYARGGQSWTYYEIDPLVRTISYDDARYFSFIVDARERGAHMELVLGDARLKLEDRATQETSSGNKNGFALLIVDAFSSDAIPVHLLTSEALDIYLSNLAEHGMLIFHISNRYLDLEPVLANLAHAKGMVGMINHDWTRNIPGKSASSWVVLARQEKDLARLALHGLDSTSEQPVNEDLRQNLLHLAANGGKGILDHLADKDVGTPWRPIRGRHEVGVWSDDFSNLLRVYNWDY